MCSIGECLMTLYRCHLELQRRDCPESWCRWQLWCEVILNPPLLCFCLSIQSIDDSTNCPCFWFLILYLKQYTQHLWQRAFACKVRVQRSLSSSETVSILWSWEVVLPDLGAGLGLGFVVAMVTLTEPRASHCSMNLSLTLSWLWVFPLCCSPERLCLLKLSLLYSVFLVNSQVALPVSCEFSGGEWWRTSFSDVLL